MKLENSKAECGDREGKSTTDGINRRFSCLRSSRSAVFDMFPKVLVLDKLNENILLVSEKIHIFYPFAGKFRRHDCNFFRCSIQNLPMCSRQRLSGLLAFIRKCRRHSLKVTLHRSYLILILFFTELSLIKSYFDCNPLQNISIQFSFFKLLSIL